MGNFGIKALKPDAVGTVLIADDKDLSFTSKYRHMKLRAKGKATSTTFNFAHGLGYKPAFDGYLLDSGRYFLNYFANPFDGYQFEYSSSYGEICTDATNVICEHSTANKLIYLCYVNPADTLTGAQAVAALGNWGVKMSNPSENVLTAVDGKMSLTTKFETPLIIASGEITVNIDAIAADGANPDVRKTNTSDYNHGLGAAHHIIMPDAFGVGSFFNFSTEPTGLGPDYIVSDVEIYIDATKIRVRVSRYAHSSVSNISAGATTWTVKYFITNIRLPS